MTGTSASSAVVNIHGASVPVAGSLTAGNTLQVTGGSALGYAPLNLAGGANTITGVLPTGNQANQTMGGDISGTTNSTTVAKIRGTTVSTNSVANDGYALVSTGGTYVPTGVATVFRCIRTLAPSVITSMMTLQLSVSYRRQRCGRWRHYTCASRSIQTYFFH